MMKGLHPGPQVFGEGSGQVRDDHELLDIQVVRGVLAAVDDVHHRRGQSQRPDLVRRVEPFVHVAVERQSGLQRPGPAGGHADGEDGVGAQVALVLAAVHLDHRLVQPALVGNLTAEEPGRELVVDVAHRLHHRFAEIAGLVAVPQLQGLTGAGGGAGRHGGPAQVPGSDDDIGFNGRVAAGIEDLTGTDTGDLGHGVSPCRYGENGVIGLSVGEIVTTNLLRVFEK